MSFFSYHELKPWIDILSQKQNGITAVVIACMWFFTRKRVTSNDITDLKDSINKKLDEQEQSATDRLEEHAERLTCLEIDMKHMPTQNDITGMNLRIDKVHGALQRVDGRLEGINRAVDLMNQHLINRGE